LGRIIAPIAFPGSNPGSNVTETQEIRSNTILLNYEITVTEGTNLNLLIAVELFFVYRKLKNFATNLNEICLKSMVTGFFSGLNTHAHKRSDV